MNPSKTAQLVWTSFQGYVSVARVKVRKASLFPPRVLYRYGFPRVLIGFSRGTKRSVRKVSDGFTIARAMGCIGGGEARV